MELLKKSVSDKEDKRKDNSDKKPLFGKERHPHTATFYKGQWSFIEDMGVRENIAYQMQYIEFMVYLYNDYQIYLTIESLLCKDIMVAVGGIVEAALFDGIESARKKLGMAMGERTDFTVLLERNNLHESKKEIYRGRRHERWLCAGGEIAWMV